MYKARHPNGGRVIQTHIAWMTTINKMLLPKSSRWCRELFQNCQTTRFLLWAFRGQHRTRENEKVAITWDPPPPPKKKRDNNRSLFTDWVREIEVKRICHDQSNRRWSRAGRNKAVKCHIFLAVALLFSWRCCCCCCSYYPSSRNATNSTSSTLFLASTIEYWPDRMWAFQCAGKVAGQRLQSRNWVRRFDGDRSTFSSCETSVRPLRSCSNCRLCRTTT